MSGVFIGSFVRSTNFGCMHCLRTWDAMQMQYSNGLSIFQTSSPTINMLEGTLTSEERQTNTNHDASRVLIFRHRMIMFLPGLLRGSSCQQTASFSVSSEVSSFCPRSAMLQKVDAAQRSLARGAQQHRCVAFALPSTTCLSHGYFRIEAVFDNTWLTPAKCFAHL